MQDLATLTPKAFIHRNRGVLAGLLVFLLGGISVAAVVVVRYTQLPEPEAADRRGIVRWLIETRLPDQPQELQLRLLARVEQELLAGIDLRDALVQIDPARRELLATNVDWLADVWFHREAAAYYATPEAGRSAMLDRQLKRIAELRIFEQLEVIEAAGTSSAGPTAKSASNQSSVVSQAKPSPAATAVPARTIVRVERWIHDSDPAKRAQLEAYFGALRGRMLWHSFQKLFS